MEWLVFLIVIGLISSVFNQNKRGNNSSNKNPKNYRTPNSYPRPEQPRTQRAERSPNVVENTLKDLDRRLNEQLSSWKRDENEPNIIYEESSMQPNNIEIRTRNTEIFKNVEELAYEDELRTRRIYDTTVKDNEPTFKSVKELARESEEKTDRVYNQYLNNKDSSLSLKSPYQGMIWSEIYGTPRSKRPHYSFTKYMIPKK